MEDREERRQRSAGPGKAGLRGWPKALLCRKLLRKMCSGIRQDLVNIVWRYCPFKALPPFFFLLFSIHSFPWASEPQVFLWLLSFLLVRLVCESTLHRVHGRTKILSPKEQRSRLYIVWRLPTPGPIHTPESAVTGERVCSADCDAKSLVAKYLVILRQRQGEEVVPSSYNKLQSVP